MATFDKNLTVGLNPVKRDYLIHTYFQMVGVDPAEITVLIPSSGIIGFIHGMEIAVAKLADDCLNPVKRDYLIHTNGQGANNSKTVGYVLIPSSGIIGFILGLGLLSKILGEIRKGLNPVKRDYLIHTTAYLVVVWGAILVLIPSSGIIGFILEIAKQRNGPTGLLS